MPTPKGSRQHLAKDPHRRDRMARKVARAVECAPNLLQGAKMVGLTKETIRSYLREAKFDSELSATIEKWRAIEASKRRTFGDMSEDALRRLMGRVNVMLDHMEQTGQFNFDEQELALKSIVALAQANKAIGDTEQAKRAEYSHAARMDASSKILRALRAGLVLGLGDKRKALKTLKRVSSQLDIVEELGKDPIHRPPALLPAPTHRQIGDGQVIEAEIVKESEKQ